MYPDARVTGLKDLIARVERKIVTVVFYLISLGKSIEVKNCVVSCLMVGCSGSWCREMGLPILDHLFLDLYMLYLVLVLCTGFV